MGEDTGLSRQSFRYLAQAAGLKTEDPHLDTLYAYLREALPKLKGADQAAHAGEAADKGEVTTIIRRYMPKLRPLGELPLSGLDPAMVFRPLPGGGND
jgi:hypothetical protein